MIAAGWHELAALTGGPAEVPRALAALKGPDGPPRGIRPRADTGLPPAATLTAAGLRYVSAPADAWPQDAGVPRVDLDRWLSDAAYLAPALAGLTESIGGGTGAWHQALQLAIGRALSRGEHTTLTFHPGLLECRDALDVFIETLDLLAGLVRAGRLWTPTLDQLTASRPPRTEITEHAHHFAPGRSECTLLLLHGTGGDERQLLPLAAQLAPDAAVLGVRGRVLEHGARRYFARSATGELDIRTSCAAPTSWPPS